MKKNLLLFTFLFIGSLAYSQSCGYGSMECGTSDRPNYNHQTPTTTTTQAVEFDVQVFPNPSVNYIKISDNSRVRMIRVYTLNGSMLKEYQVLQPESSYDVSDLADGSYLIRFFDWKNKPLKAKLFQKISTESQR
ncbi:MAG: T9SS type A sorting domain-containing protein [Bacteroidota bacterium]